MENREHWIALAGMYLVVLIIFLAVRKNKEEV